MRMRLPPYIVRQLGNPTGILGRLLLGRLNSSNRNMNAITFRSLEIVTADRVLEIGFGGGALLESIISTGPSFVAGAEISDVALQSMHKRRRRSISNGRLELVKIESNSIPYPAHAFTKACCVNVVYFWTDPALVLAEVFRVLDAGGKFVVCYEETGPDGRIFPLELVESYLNSAGFIDLLTVAEEDKRNGRYFCTTATRPAGNEDP